MRTALFHYLNGATSEKEIIDMYKLGENSYFSESAYKMDNFH